MQETLCLRDCSSFSTLKYLRRILYKIQHVYSTIHQLCSNSHQLVNIFVIINRLFFHTTVFIHPIFESTGIINSMHIFLSSEYFQSHWYPTTKQRLILKAHVFNFPNRFWKVFFWNQILLQIWIGLLDLECLQ